MTDLFQYAFFLLPLLIMSTLLMGVLAYINATNWGFYCLVALIQLLWYDHIDLAKCLVPCFIENAFFWCSLLTLLHARATLQKASNNIRLNVVKCIQAKKRHTK
jgi:hypothetical protein